MILLINKLRFPVPNLIFLLRLKEELRRYEVLLFVIEKLIKTLEIDLICFSGNTVQESTGQQYDNKTGQWFGSLVTSSGEDGVVLVRHQSNFSISQNYPSKLPHRFIYQF